MDRERKDELPQMQVEFIDAVCKPLYSTLSDSFPWIKPLLDGCMANREKWADLAEKVSYLVRNGRSLAYKIRKNDVNSHVILAFLYLLLGGNGIDLDRL